MYRNATVALGAIVFVAATAFSLAPQPPASPYPAAKPEPVAPAGSVARGRQLVDLGGCHDCHTPKLQNGALDRTKLLSGHPANAPLAPEVVGGASTNMLLTAWRGPWGVTLSRNLTPDKESGLGSWTRADFKKALRTGVNPKGEVLRPPMPIGTLQNLPDQDLDAIWAYLATLTPIRNVVGRVDPVKR